MDYRIGKLSTLVKIAGKIGRNTDNLIAFRGEKRDYEQTALVPLVYRENYIKKEELIYRESQRFNDEEFKSDKSTFDKLSRIQHYTAPTRLIDLSEDLLSAIYFAIADKDKNDKNDAIIYIFEIDKSKIKYYDSDAVSVISNLAKIPNDGISKKSHQALIDDVIKYKKRIKKFNKSKSVKYLMHEIREEKPQFKSIIKPWHLTSIQFVLPKLTSSRVRSQKGAFLLFGLGKKNKKPIRLLKKGKLVKSNSNAQHPVLAMHKILIKHSKVQKMRKELVSLGVKKSFIYPEIDKVSEYLKDIYKNT